MAFGGFFGGGSSSSSNNDKDTSSSSNSPSTPISNIPSGFGALPPSTPSTNASSSEIRTRIQNAVVTQSNVANAKFLIAKINENCFDHCVPEPGASLSSKESSCLSSCMEKYIEAWNVASKTYFKRLQTDGAQFGGMAGGAPAGKEMF